MISAPGGIFVKPSGADLTILNKKGYPKITYILIIFRSVPGKGGMGEGPERFSTRTAAGLAAAATVSYITSAHVATTPGSSG